MKYKVEEALNFKHASNGLIGALKSAWAGEDISKEDFDSFKYDGKFFSLINIGEDPIEVGYKYEYGGEYWQLVEFKPTEEKKWCCEENIVAKYDVQVFTPWSRSGSHFSEWYYEYKDAIYNRITIKDVPEVIIPAHKEVEVVEL